MPRVASSDDLSPVAVPAEPTTLPFSLTWSDVAGCLPGCVASGRAWVSHVKRGRHQGGHPSVIITLSYRDAEGVDRERTVFFKRNTGESREAHRYRFLSERGISLPAVLVCVERPNEEVLGLEFLPFIGVRAEDVNDVLQLIAGLNAVIDVPDDVATLHPGMKQAEFEHLVAGSLVRLDAMWPEFRARAWLDVYRDAHLRHEKLPQALCHGELAAQQVGHASDGRLVLFDLATVAKRARFADIANMLRFLAARSGRTERELMTLYLQHLDAAGGATVHLDEAWPELLLTRVVQEIEAIPWRTTLADNTDLYERARMIDHDLTAVRPNAGR